MGADDPRPDSPVALTRHDHVTRLTLRRPDRRNALNRAALEDMSRALRRLTRDRGERVVLVLGEGDAFCTGADIEELHRLRRDNDIDGFRDLLRLGEEIIGTLVREIAQPVIAVVDGPAAGSGFGLALACDLIVATGRATFGATQVRLGFHPDFALSALLPERVGSPLATEILATGRILDAHEAQRIGLIDRITTPAGLERELDALVHRFLQAPPAIISSIRALTRQRQISDVAAALAAEHEAQMLAFQSPESLARLDALRDRFTKTSLGSYRI